MQLMYEKIINVERTEHTLALFGSFDENIKIINREFNVDILNRGNDIKITGNIENVDKASKTIETLIDLLSSGEIIDEQNIRYIISLVKQGRQEKVKDMSNDCICISHKGKPIKSKTIVQKQYIDAISKNTVVFGVGPAGTGKTYLAVAMAVKFFKNHLVDKIVLTRPAVEAGEKLGFLPGDLQDKVDPYLRPLYDALFDMIGAENFQRYVEKGLIEVAPLAYMRGRTLDNSFIILDEAQNTTPEQMKMFLTRLGFNSKAVITGDLTQIDLPDKKSGLLESVKILKNVEDIFINYFSGEDVIRHKIVKQIIKAYDDFYQEVKNEKSKKIKSID